MGKKNSHTMWRRARRRAPRMITSQRRQRRCSSRHRDWDWGKNMKQRCIHLEPCWNTENQSVVELMMFLILGRYCINDIYIYILLYIYSIYIYIYIVVFFPMIRNSICMWVCTWETSNDGRLQFFSSRLLVMFKRETVAVSDAFGASQVWETTTIIE